MHDMGVIKSQQRFLVSTARYCSGFSSCKNPQLLAERKIIANVFLQAVRRGQDAGGVHINTCRADNHTCCKVLT